MKKLALVLTFAAIASLATIATSDVARAEIGTADQVPAATLLLPYFEVDLANPAGVSTSFWVNNASSSAAVAHVTLWTDEGIPTFNFDIYLTGYDAEKVDLRSLFDTGIVPITADAGSDPTDTISPKGPLSQDINLVAGSAPCGGVYTSPELTDAELRHIRTAHTGRRSAVLNGCASAQYGDLIARGYVTVDSVSTCTVVNPSDPSYFTGIADSRNILWGDYTIQNDANHTSAGSSLVPIEACDTPSVGNGAGLCPFASGDYTFYGRLNGFTATDGREPLATTFAIRYSNGGTFDASDLLVWRDPKLPPTGANGKHKCTKHVGWFPLLQGDAVAFDETENPTDLCFLRDNVPPVVGGTQKCFPLATQRVSTTAGNPLGYPLSPPSQFGWFYLNLNHALPTSDPEPDVAQAWVEATQSASGRFSIGYKAIALDNADKTSPGGQVLLP